MDSGDYDLDDIMCFMAMRMFIFRSNRWLQLRNGIFHNWGGYVVDGLPGIVILSGGPTSLLHASPYGVGP